METAAVLLAGGTGTRLYPASRSDRPKQFLALDGDDSLLRRTADRVAFADHVYVVTRDAYATEARDIVPEATVLVEPGGKDTGPALAYATHRVREKHGDCVVFATPSDHHVDGDFASTAERACEVAAETDALVTVGVEPDRPATGYGYLELGAERDGYAEVASFREKPDAERARDLVDAGCLWNAGIFAWTPDAFVAESTGTPLEPLVDALDRGDEEAGFRAVESVSVDYAVMERADRVACVPAEFGWDDLGTWDALERVLDAEDGNAVLGDALGIDAAGNVVASDDKHVSLVGVEDLVVAAYDDRVLVLPKEDADRVREVVAELRGEDAF
ncbi:mannose-1-phosphate guanylyltransferase [Halocalculus aciditolerans]|uniref:Mannose-1-phosphate guanyltransferase n=1 Tax=Halocalculus aciditolerans TaxID=1383812 RepID=A0A830FF54_9EURY|nr:sugar phosphate nucleotidyltransferase [Halocalculus aciditolerans]GGL49241.1 mannose-1-phosphate guanyltransferase [Halocalculus aciditolerans]